MLPRSCLTTRALLAAALLLGAAGCGAEATPPPAAPTGPQKPAAAAKPASLPAGHLARSDVDAALAKGPPWLLRRVGVEEVIREGKFIGWRVVAMPNDWAGIDLKPGDVVTRVNGMTLEKPDDLYSVWTSLVVASDLKIAYERDGASREVIFHIEGDPSKDAATALKPDAVPPRRTRPKGTVVITEEEQPPADGSAE